jgi:hypothetical protein
MVAGQSCIASPYVSSPPGGEYVDQRRKSRYDKKGLILRERSLTKRVYETDARVFDKTSHGPDLFSLLYAFQKNFSVPVDG